MKTTIAEVRAGPLDIELHTPFGIAAGSVSVARNAAVEVRLEDGTVGLGEAAPFAAVNGETREDALRAIGEALPALLGADAARYRKLSASLVEAIPDSPSARCALETAVLDALARQAGWSLWHFFGGREEFLSTDITIVTGSVEASAEAAVRAADDGFSILKIKVGGCPQEVDIERLRAIAVSAPRARWILDGNCAFDPEAAHDLIARLGGEARRILLFEQPTPANDLGALRQTAERTGLVVAADESARNAEHVARIAEAGAAGVINIKITKSGLIEAIDMIAAAKAHGLGLMIGGMVESAIAMSTSACLAAGVGGFRYVDLDTPLFMRNSPARGGYEQEGEKLSLAGIGAGHGVALDRIAYSVPT